MNYETANSLIRLLENLPESVKDLPILVACDDEGNSCRGLPLGWVTPAYTDEESLWRTDSFWTEEAWAEDEDNDSTPYVPNIIVVG